MIILDVIEKVIYATAISSDLKIFLPEVVVHVLEDLVAELDVAERRKSSKLVSNG